MTLALSTPKPFSPPTADPYADLDTVTHVYVAFALENGGGVDRTAMADMMEGTTLADEITARLEQFVNDRQC